MVDSLKVRHRLWTSGFWLFVVIAAAPASAQSGQATYPNLLVDASARFVATGLAQSLDYTQPLNDYILGAHVTGQGHTTGAMEAELVADPNHATMRWRVGGLTDLQTVGRQRRVTVWGDGITTFTAHKVLTFDETAL